MDTSKIILITDIGITAFTLTVNSANFAGTVAQKIYNFNLVVSCTVSSLSPVSTLLHIYYDPIAVPYTPTIVTPAFTVIPANKCGQ